MSLEFQHLVDPLHPLVQEKLVKSKVLAEVHRENVQDEGRHNLVKSWGLNLKKFDGLNSCTSRHRGSTKC